MIRCIQSQKEAKFAFAWKSANQKSVLLNILQWPHDAEWMSHSPTSQYQQNFFVPPSYLSHSISISIYQAASLGIMGNPIESNLMR